MKKYYYLPKNDPFFIGAPHKKDCPKRKRSTAYLFNKQCELKMLRNWEKIKAAFCN